MKIRSTFLLVQYLLLFFTASVQSAVTFGSIVEVYNAMPENSTFGLLLFCKRYDCFYSILPRSGRISFLLMINIAV